MSHNECVVDIAMKKKDDSGVQDLFDRTSTATPRVKRIGWAAVKGKAFPAAVTGVSGMAIKVVLLGRGEPWTIHPDRFTREAPPIADPNRVEIMKRILRVLKAVGMAPATVVSLAAAAGMSVSTFGSNMRFLMKIGWVMKDDVRFNPGDIPPGETEPLKKHANRCIVWRNPNIEPE